MEEVLRPDLITPGRVADRMVPFRRTEVRSLLLLSLEPAARLAVASLVPLLPHLAREPFARQFFPGMVVVAVGFGMTGNLSTKAL